MASPTQQTRLKRKRKESASGKKRKAKNRAEGTTRSMAELFGDDK